MTRGRKPSSNKPLYVSGSPQMPGDYGVMAKRCWESVAANLPDGTLGEIDETLLDGLCRWYEVWALNMQGGSKGKGSYKRMALAAMAWKHFAVAAAKFGIGPADRARLRLYAEAEDVTDPIVKLLG